MNDPTRFDGFDGSDEPPKTFAELKPPGYWSKTLGSFVPVREMTEEDIEEAKERWLDWFGYIPDSLK